MERLKHSTKGLKVQFVKKLCWQPGACRFMPIHWMGEKKSLLVAFGYSF
jgi:hypothetical protein